jgi:RimJ/RimL family protein N-acetyltransferase
MKAWPERDGPPGRVEAVRGDVLGGRAQLVSGPVRLEPLSVEHADDLESLAQDPDVQRNTYVPVPPPRGFGRTWAARYEEGRREGTRDGFAILDPEDGAFLGIAVAVRLDDEAGEAELGYIVARRARGRGIASAALAALSEWGFERGLERLELRINSDNEASMRVAERCGYTREGMLRSVHFKAGTRTDVVVYSRVRADPELTSR